MNTLSIRLEDALQSAFEASTSRPPCPPRLAEAMRYAVWPGGGRVRPLLTLQIAAACGDRWPRVADAAAAAVELIHCASLVHDDLPCFDDAPLRRGRPTVHRAYGESTAVLVGDALIVMAFEVLAGAGAEAPHRLPGLVQALASGVGAPRGIIAGQAWESEPCPDLVEYHRAKTGALFESAALLGALAGGGDAAAWAEVGGRIGEAYQIADDLADALGGDHGKLSGQDQRHERPSAVAALGVNGAIGALWDRIEAAEAAMPACRDADSLRAFLRKLASRLAPGSVAEGAPGSARRVTALRPGAPALSWR